MKHHQPNVMFFVTALVMIVFCGSCASPDRLISELSVPVITESKQLPNYVGRIITVRVIDHDYTKLLPKSPTLLGVAVSDFGSLKSSRLQATGQLESFIVNDGPCELCATERPVTHSHLSPGVYYRLRDINGTHLARVQFAPSL